MAFVQRLRLVDPAVLPWLLSGALLLGGFIALLLMLSTAMLASLSSLLGNLALFGMIVVFSCAGA